MKLTAIAAAAVISASLVTIVSYAQSPPLVAYPEGYRNWTHVKSMIIDKGHSLFDAFGGIHHIYANKAALKGYQSGTFPDGAVIIFDLLEATKTADNAVVEGKRKVLGVMRKDKKLYAKTGGWGYEGFKGDSKTERVVGAKMLESCHGCHEQQKGRDYVFSSYRK